MKSDEYFDAIEVASVEELEATRRRSLTKVLRVAAEELPFYRKLWSAAGVGLDPAPTADRLPSIPIVRKTELIEATRRARSIHSGIEAMLGREPTNVVVTSGTGGFQSFALLTDQDLDGAGLLAQARELWAMKVRSGMRVLSLSPAWHALGLFETRALTEIGAIPVIPWGSLTPRFIQGLVSAVDQLEPEHLLVTARAIRMMLAECIHQGLDPRRVFRSVRYVGCAGEAISPQFRAHVLDRLELEDLFERGGSGDGMFGGAECFAHRGHHISADVHLVEIISPLTGEVLGPGERGCAAITNLSLGRSIFIRFDTEDVAEIVPGACPCGRTHPVVEFYGRLSDSVIFENRILTPADVRAGLDEGPVTRFRPFSMAGNGSTLRIGLQGADTMTTSERDQSVAALESRLGVGVDIVPATVGRVGWKEVRVEPMGGDR